MVSVMIATSCFDDPFFDINEGNGPHAGAALGLFVVIQHVLYFYKLGHSKRQPSVITKVCNKDTGVAKRTNAWQQLSMCAT